MKRHQINQYNENLRFAQTINITESERKKKNCCFMTINETVT